MAAKKKNLIVNATVVDEKASADLQKSKYKRSRQANKPLQPFRPKGNPFPVDTISLYCRPAFNTNELKDAGWLPNVKTNVKTKFIQHSWVRAIRLFNGVIIYLLYTAHQFGIGPFLLIVFSVPKVLHGNNFTPVENPDRVWEIVNHALGRLPELHNKVRVEDCIVSRLDSYLDYLVGDFIDDYFLVFRDLPGLYRKGVTAHTNLLKKQSVEDLIKELDFYRQVPNGITHLGSVQKLFYITKKKKAQFGL